MKDSYDPLDWNKGTDTQGYTHYSSDDYDKFANNPTYRSEGFQGDGQSYQGYDQGYQSYDNNGYSQPYQDSYNQGYDGYQNGYYGQPQQYTQADYDNSARNATYREPANPNKMSDEQFHSMIEDQKRRELRRDQINDFIFSGTPLSSHYGEGGGDLLTKDSLLYLLFCGFGAALARLFSLPLWLYPAFATFIGYAVTIAKKCLADSTPFKQAVKESIVEACAFAVGIGFSIYFVTR